jgi:hypothetical protein
VKTEGGEGKQEGGGGDYWGNKVEKRDKAGRESYTDILQA